MFRKAWDDLISNVQTFGPLLTQIKVYKRGKEAYNETIWITLITPTGALFVP